MISKLAPGLALSIGLLFTAALFAEGKPGAVNVSDRITMSCCGQGDTCCSAVKGSVIAAGTQDCCKQNLACCKEKRACCSASAKLGCCAKGMKCCTKDAACCSAPQDCCRLGLACCDEGKACCGTTPRQTGKVERR